jgi:hypothetical protein
MLGQGDEPHAAEPGTAFGDMDSGSATSSLSDPFVVITAVKATPSTRRRVKAPEGSSAMEVRRSSRVAAAKSRPLLLPAVEEEPSQFRPLVDPLGNTADLRGAVNPQMVSSASGTGQVGRKCSASSAAPGSARRAPNPHLLASAADFSPGHFTQLCWYVYLYRFIIISIINAITFYSLHNMQNIFYQFFFEQVDDFGTRLR